ncbi:hypothetical protein [Brachyspira hyodysenteriae]|uniref:Uncharacterized protein n=1 Tax=Brachyspira hyodysenteriae (strain ATCC 49526 / WA1) TaxID=565034 RepID=A0A3B6V9K1_BRAHW|nr:hypothetical protein [Brachyspira hyodysenteriae]ACN83629.1 hypothetical protein BHWA1_01149 [Brachyspira hyodysenteriae WA1]KLI40355.1 hypothetical protein SZ53_08315 [Brachyspira hyodysenteriae]KLI41935.1 hypothetical protein SZ40_11110 [Brachyspira hyodysenteriae]KLI54205.1 hypothetical protein SZ45_12455 [Brachyspira hyodysenteriae]MCZ9919036.1 hypothetical protein [Brachyspira hyodysenteriae]
MKEVAYKICMNEEELVNALMSDDDVIYIEHKLGNKVSNIKNTGKIAWGVLIGGVLVAATAIVSSKKFGKDKALIASSIATIPSAGVAIIYIGLPSTISLIQIIIQAYKKNDGINGAKDLVLKLRNNYYIAEKDREKLTLKKTADEKVKEVKITEIKKAKEEK